MQGLAALEVEGSGDILESPRLATPLGVQVYRLLKLHLRYRATKHFHWEGVLSLNISENLNGFT